MKIGLYNLEPKIKNTALMQISYFHKSKGDDVERYNPLFHNCYNKVYASSIFDFTPKTYVRKNMICGGTGFDIASRLPPDIELTHLDYSLFPDCKESFLWFSRGCFRDCPFCIVRQKEGFIYPTNPKNLNPQGRIINVMDNNFFGCKTWQSSISYLIKADQKVNFSSGLDIRIFNKKQGLALKKLRLAKLIHIAWDNPQENIIPKLKLFLKYIPYYKIVCYVLVGFWSNEYDDLRRLQKLRELKVQPFVMPFNKTDPYQKTLARYVNRPEIFKSCTWEDYKAVKGVVF